MKVWTGKYWHESFEQIWIVSRENSLYLVQAYKSHEREDAAGELLLVPEDYLRRLISRNELFRIDDTTSFVEGNTSLINLIRRFF